MLKDLVRSQVGDVNVFKKRSLFPLLPGRLKEVLNLKRAPDTWVSLDGHTWVLLSPSRGMVSEVSPESESSGLTELSRSFSLS